MYCQKCRAPLKLDNSLADLNPAAFELLVASSSQKQPKRQLSSRLTYPNDSERRALYDRVSKDTGSATFKRNSSALRSDGQPRDSSAMSFVLLTESQVAPPRLTPPIESPNPRQQRRISMSNGQRNDGKPAQPHEAERINKLFEILSARSDIDHPICVECTEMLVDGLQKKLESTARERDAYAAFLKQVQADVPNEEDIAESEQALAKARKAEEESMKQLAALEKEKAALDLEIAALEEESAALDTEEEQFWRERNAFTTKLTEFQNERDSINSRFDHDSQLLTKLQRANVYNDTFSIHHDGHFATINGLRLGRLSAKPVDWPEINAAWGQALLLVVTVADKLGYKFDSYEPLPMGSTSKIVRYDYQSPSSSRLGGHRSGPPPAPKKTVLELFCSGDLPLQMLFNRKFDQGMVAFLELVRQLGAFVHQQTKNSEQGGYTANPLALPYKIEGDKIGDDRIGHFSIKLGMNTDESWTKACKFALTCCKFLIAHASNVSHVTNGR
ncbi:APG6-domain-containing protein [Annulohypoxylon truncatum]|uniref:APG6-domain-containing protein n=1 Tax=Annulohypoxylon truncatum TaxID=327061 RepID=UPI002008118A|nr:APG6-domain-containing protein [Annulohypoxylon truncatum]KAI1205437.1 APG6-domain-containing protein [Annulohypoxylon truncatum]